MVAIRIRFIFISLGIVSLNEENFRGRNVCKRMGLVKGMKNNVTKL